MRSPLLALVVLPVLFAGCAEPAPERSIAVLEMLVETKGNTTIAFGEVLGSQAGTVVAPYRYDDATHTLVGDVPAHATHLLLVEQPEAKPRPADTLLANATRATAERPDSEVPTIFEFEPERGPAGIRFDVTVVQPGHCYARVNNRNDITDGKGPFSVQDLAAGEGAVIAFDAVGPGCPAVRLTLRNVGLWKVVPTSTLDG